MKKIIFSFALVLLSFHAFAVQDFSKEALKNFKMDSQIPEIQHRSFLKSQKTHGCDPAGQGNWKPDPLIQIGDTSEDVVSYSTSDGDYVQSRNKKVVGVDHLTRVLTWEYSSNFIKLPFYQGTGVIKNPYNALSCQMVGGSGSVNAHCVDVDKETNFDPQVLVQKADYINK